MGKGEGAAFKFRRRGAGGTKGPGPRTHRRHWQARIMIMYTRAVSAHTQPLNLRLSLGEAGPAGQQDRAWRTEAATTTGPGPQGNKRHFPMAPILLSGEWSLNRC